MIFFNKNMNNFLTFFDVINLLKNKKKNSN